MPKQMLSVLARVVVLLLVLAPVPGPCTTLPAGECMQVLAASRGSEGAVPARVEASAAFAMNRFSQKGTVDPATLAQMRQYGLESLLAPVLVAQQQGPPTVALLRAGHVGQAADAATLQLRLLSAVKPAAPSDYPQAIEVGARMIHEARAAMPGGLEQNAIPPALERRQASEVVAGILKAFFPVVMELRKAYAECLIAVAAESPGDERTAALARVAKECQGSKDEESFALRSALQGIEAEGGSTDRDALAALRDACAAAPAAPPSR